MGRSGRWSPADIDLVRELAEQPGQYASVIGKRFGVTLLSVLTLCGRHGIPIVRYTPDEQAYADKMNKERERRKYEKRRAKEQPAHLRRIAVHLGTSRTHPIYRNQLPKLPENTSREALRRMITEAVRNTAEMQT